MHATACDSNVWLYYSHNNITNGIHTIWKYRWSTNTIIINQGSTMVSNNKFILSSSLFELSSHEVDVSNLDH